MCALFDGNVRLVTNIVTCYKVVLITLIHTRRNKNVTKLTSQSCNNIVINITTVSVLPEQHCNRCDSRVQAFNPCYCKNLPKVAAESSSLATDILLVLAEATSISSLDCFGSTTEDSCWDVEGSGCLVVLPPVSTEIYAIKV